MVIASYRYAFDALAGNDFDAASVTGLKVLSPLVPGGNYVEDETNGNYDVITLLFKKGFCCPRGKL